MKPKNWIQGVVMGGQIALPLIFTTIMTGGMGDGVVLNAETSSISLEMEASSYTSTPLTGEQWGTGGLYSTEEKTTTLLGTGQKGGYWGTITDEAGKIGLNLVANEANPGGFSYLNADASKYDLSTLTGRQAFFDQVNKPFLDAAISRGDKILMLDDPYNVNAIFPKGNTEAGNNFFGMERNYLASKGFTFANGEAIYPANQSNWHPPMTLPAATTTTQNK